MFILQETHVPHASIELHDDTLWFFSTSIHPHEFAKREGLSASQKEQKKFKTLGIEYAGVGCVVRAPFKACISKLTPFDCRFLQSTFRAAPDLTFLNCHATQAVRPDSEKAAFL